MCIFFFFKQKTAYEMRISDWSSDVCSSDLPAPAKSVAGALNGKPGGADIARHSRTSVRTDQFGELRQCGPRSAEQRAPAPRCDPCADCGGPRVADRSRQHRSARHGPPSYRESLLRPLARKEPTLNPKSTSPT